MDTFSDAELPSPKGLDMKPVESRISFSSFFQAELNNGMVNKMEEGEVLCQTKIKTEPADDWSELTPCHITRSRSIDTKNKTEALQGCGVKQIKTEAQGEGHSCPNLISPAKTKLFPEIHGDNHMNECSPMNHVYTSTVQSSVPCKIEPGEVVSLTRVPSLIKSECSGQNQGIVTFTPVTVQQIKSTKDEDVFNSLPQDPNLVKAEIEEQNRSDRLLLLEDYSDSVDREELNLNVLKGAGDNKSNLFLNLKQENCDKYDKLNSPDDIKESSDHCLLEAISTNISSNKNGNSFCLHNDKNSTSTEESFKEKKQNTKCKFSKRLKNISDEKLRQNCLIPCFVNLGTKLHFERTGILREVTTIEETAPTLQSNKKSESNCEIGTTLRQNKNSNESSVLEKKKKDVVSNSIGEVKEFLTTGSSSNCELRRLLNGNFNTNSSCSETNGGNCYTDLSSSDAGKRRSPRIKTLKSSNPKENQNLSFHDDVFGSDYESDDSRTSNEGSDFEYLTDESTDSEGEKEGSAVLTRSILGRFISKQNDYPDSLNQTPTVAQCSAVPTNLETHSSVSQSSSILTNSTIHSNVNQRSCVFPTVIQNHLSTVTIIPQAQNTVNQCKIPQPSLPIRSLILPTTLQSQLSTGTNVAVPQVPRPVNQSRLHQPSANQSSEVFPKTVPSRVSTNPCQGSSFVPQAKCTIDQKQLPNSNALQNNARNRPPSPNKISDLHVVSNVVECSETPNSRVAVDKDQVSLQGLLHACPRNPVLNSKEQASNSVWPARKIEPVPLVTKNNPSPLLKSLIKRKPESSSIGVSMSKVTSSDDKDSKDDKIQPNAMPVLSKGKDNKINKSPAKPVKRLRTEPTDPVILQCKQCGKIVTSESKLKIHMQKHKKPKICHICGKSASNSVKLSAHLLIHKKKYKCSLCETEWSSKYNLHTHMLSHTGEKPFSCDQCGKGFARIDNWQSHIRKVHPGIPSYLCSKCEEKFHTLAEKKAHIKTAHPLSDSQKPKNTRCPHCERKFRPDRLRAHLKCHVEGKIPAIRKYSCNMCCRKFNTKKNYRRHLEHHRTGQIFTCDLCTLTFGLTKVTRKFAMKDETSTKYVCELCYLRWLEKNHSENISAMYHEARC